MDLTIDIGNTRIKAGLFENKELKTVRVYNDTQALLSDPILADVSRIMIASVTMAHEPIMNSLAHKNPILFTTATPVPLKNKYKTSTLGTDRLAASLGSMYFKPNANVLTVDAGTCIKYNFVNHQNEFLGGAISPGLEMRAKALHTFTSKLPEVKLDTSFTQLIGDDTTSSILSGVMLGAVAEVEKTIEWYMAQHKGLQVFFTGGDADYLCGQLKSRFFVNPNLVLYGLYQALVYNFEK